MLLCGFSIQSILRVLYLDHSLARQGFEAGQIAAATTWLHKDKIIIVAVDNYVLDDNSRWLISIRYQGPGHKCLMLLIILGGLYILEAVT